MSSDEQTIVAQRQTPVEGAFTGEQVVVGPEEQIARLQRVALPSAQWQVERRQSRDALAVIARILAAIGLYCIPVIALCVAISALGYFMWIVIDVARSAGSLDFTRVGDAFGHFDEAARVFMASAGYALLALTLYLLAAAVRVGETWAPLVVTVIVAAPVILFFTLSLDLALSLAPADLFPGWSHGAIEAVVLAHTIFLAVLLRGRRPVTQALNHLAFTRRYDMGTFYAGELPRLHVIRFSSGAPPVASAPPPVPNSPAPEPPAPTIVASATETADLEMVDAVTDDGGVAPHAELDQASQDSAPTADPEVEPDTDDEPEAV